MKDIEFIYLLNEEGKEEKMRVITFFKIEDLNECEIVLKCKRFKIKIIGENLKISTLAKGEIEVVGNVVGVAKI